MLKVFIVVCLVVFARGSGVEKKVREMKTSFFSVVSNETISVENRKKELEVLKRKYEHELAELGGCPQGLEVDEVDGKKNCVNRNKTSTRVLSKLLKTQPRQKNTVCLPVIGFMCYDGGWCIPWGLWGIYGFCIP
ncbi:hypothetical protein M3Y94_00005300 [Aphelenchoides besseyi]|nr:hypothetical protein M3Y94_00005300 [Aphelenchoides besseyi]KAI6220763.1 hypothetical protein M3Y95_01030500 [Aphelenchoides besseyi]